MIPKEIEELLKNSRPLKEPQINKDIIKSCGNCMDLIVCWAYGEIEEAENEEQDELTNIERAKDCPYWKLDFLTYQDMFIKSNTQNEEKGDTI